MKKTCGEQQRHQGVQWLAQGALGLGQLKPVIGPNTNRHHMFETEACL